MTYVFLAIAIVAEVAATTCLKLSDGFSKPVTSIATVTLYAVSFYFLSLTLRSLPTGLVYAVWSGVGVVLIATIAWVFQSQKLDTPALCGMALIVSGVVVINLFSNATALSKCAIEPMPHCSSSPDPRGDQHREKPGTN